MEKNHELGNNINIAGYIFRYELAKYEIDNKIIQHSFSCDSRRSKKVLYDDDNIKRENNSHLIAICLL